LSTVYVTETSREEPFAPSKDQESRPSRSRWQPFVVLTAFVIALLCPLILQGRALYWGDLILYFYPNQELVRESLLQGKIPLWNPYIMCGQPLVGNPQTWIFYPSTVLLYLSPVWFYYTLNSLLHLLLCSLGMYLFLRRLSGDRLCAILGSLVFTGSAFMMARLQFPTMVQTSAYLPFLLILVDRMIDRPHIGYAALLALVVALMLLAAHPQMAYMSLLGGIVYALTRLMLIRKERRRASFSFFSMTFALILGALAASVQILPILQLFVLSTREALTWTTANRFVFRPGHLINFLVPNYYGNPSTGSYFAPGNVWEACVYIGLPPLLLAIYTAIRHIRRPAVLFFTLFGGISLWLAMGRFGGLYWFAFYLVPGLKSFHDPARFTYLTTFSLAVLAAIGLRQMRERGVANHWRVGIVLLSALNLWSFSSTFNPTTSPSALTYRPDVLDHAPRKGEGRVYTLMHELVWQRYVNYSDYGAEGDRYIRELRNTLNPNMNIHFHVEEGAGYEPVPVRHVHELAEIVELSFFRQSPRFPALLGLFNTSLLLLPPGVRYPSPYFEEVDATGVKALRLKTALPRAWLVYRTIRVDNEFRTLRAMSDPAFNPLAFAYVNGSSGLGESLFPPSPNFTGSVKKIVSDSTSAEFEVYAGDSPGFMIWSATYYPGWRAWIDGKEQTIERADHAFIGIVVPPGKSMVRFQYEPFSFRFGFYISLISSMIICAGLGYGLTMRKR
jgi:hypothetical protein